MQHASHSNLLTTATHAPPTHAGGLSDMALIRPSIRSGEIKRQIHTHERDHAPLLIFLLKWLYADTCADFPSVLTPVRQVIGIKVIISFPTHEGKSSTSFGPHGCVTQEVYTIKPTIILVNNLCADSYVHVALFSNVKIKYDMNEQHSPHTVTR